jgi:hypothetical protein
MVLLFAVRRFHEYGELRAHPTAHAATRAPVQVCHGYKLIALCVRFSGLVEDMLGTELNAERATFTALPDNVNVILLCLRGHVMQIPLSAMPEVARRIALG